MTTTARKPAKRSAKPLFTPAEILGIEARALENTARINAVLEMFERLKRPAQVRRRSA